MLSASTAPSLPTRKSWKALSVMLDDQPEERPSATTNMMMPFASTATAVRGFAWHRGLPEEHVIGMALPPCTINGRPPIESVTPGHPLDHLTETVSLTCRPVS